MSGGRFPSFIHQVIITGLNKLYDCIRFSPEHGYRCRQGAKPPLKLKLMYVSKCHMWELQQLLMKETPDPVTSSQVFRYLLITNNRFHMKAPRPSVNAVVNVRGKGH